MAIEVFRINTGAFVCQENWLLQDGRNEAIEIPFNSFLLRHIASQRIIIWDTGIAPNLEIYPPTLQESLRNMKVTPPKLSLAEVCVKNGIEVNSVKDVIYSHAHCDHMQPVYDLFPQATAWLGPGTTKHFGKGYPADPTSTVFGEVLDPALRRGAVRELSLETDTWISYGPFENAFGMALSQTIALEASSDRLWRAIDFFSDGSLLLCDAPGHCGGNLCAVVDTDKAKVVLGGGCAHHMALIDGGREIGHFSSPIHRRKCRCIMMISWRVGL